MIFPYGRPRKSGAKRASYHPIPVVSTEAAPDLEGRDRSRDGHIEGLDTLGHGDAGRDVANLTNEGPDPALASHNENRRAGQVGTVQAPLPVLHHSDGPVAEVL